MQNSYQKNNNKNLTDKQIKSSNIIYNSGADLLQLINEILDLSKIEAGKIEINYELVIIKEFITDIENQFLHVAEDKNIEMIVEVSEDFEEEIITDKMRVWQILKNFLSNSFKFTPEGNIKIKFSKTDPANKNYRNKNFDHRQGYCIEVSYTGIGIAKEKMGVIFEAFQQADGTTSRKYGGTGLGLSISRELAKLLDGYISLESEEGVGSTFSLIIPINNNSELIIPNKEDNKIDINKEQKNPYKEKRQSDNDDDNNKKIKKVITTKEKEPKVSNIKCSSNFDDTSEIDYPLSMENLHNKKVLLVDDDITNIYAISGLLEDHNMEIFTAENGVEALEILDKNREINIVLMDIMMPVMDGDEAISKIRDIIFFKELPILAVTAKVGKIERDKCIESGASDYISKPINEDKLYAMINFWLGK